MKVILIVFITIFSFNSFAQFEIGFNKEEARDMVAICNSFTFLELYHSDLEILPAGYKKTYTSGMFGMDNKYQVYQKGNVGIINLRGSTAKKISWLENINSAMIPAKGVIKVSGENFDYCFAQDTNAAVHAGYALGIAFLAKDILYQIRIMNIEGINNFIITGHSQGGALASLLRAYLENLPADQMSKGNKFKNYSFAAPMIGNKWFSREYNSKFCDANTSFNVAIKSDPIPSFPLSYNDTASFFKDNLKAFLFDKEAFSLKKSISEGSVLFFEESLKRTVKKFGTSVSEQISKDVGPVILPDYVADINYLKLNNLIEINPVDFPKVLKDPSVVKNDSLVSVYKRGADGHFLNDELYVKESWNYQHKPYNYYVSILKTYFPEEYKALKNKYLAENL
ncbi:MAG: hypothetical protein H0V01_09825 [Bacteroidetes bacterium]|nr:hypothetical protein [Bacteroidota bacterium]HET6244529.1 hypothetical protein [Bacteroidia bacterium]